MISQEAIMVILYALYGTAMHMKSKCMFYLSFCVDYIK